MGSPEAVRDSPEEIQTENCSDDFGEDLVMRRELCNVESVQGLSEKHQNA